MRASVGMLVMTASLVLPWAIAHDVDLRWQAVAMTLAPSIPDSAALAGPAKPWFFSSPEPVAILGYSGDAMEPFMTRDGRHLLFNNSNDPSVNTNLHYAERVDDLTFVYKGELRGVNTPALEGVASVDRANVLYFVSNQSYTQTLSTIYRGNFLNGEVSGVELVPGISRQQPGIVNFDVEVSPDGNTLYFVDSQFAGSTPQNAHLVIAERHGSVFQRAANSDAILQNVNSDVFQYAACISGDGRSLFFTRAQAGFVGGPSIYLATRNDVASPFAPPHRLALITGFVEGPTLSADEQSLYYHKKVAEQFAIYRVARRFQPTRRPPHTVQ
jgi:hypothetical protein